MIMFAMLKVTTWFRRQDTITPPPKAFLGSSFLLDLDPIWEKREGTVSRLLWNKTKSWLISKLESSDQAIITITESGLSPSE